jgi:hypothetical protein
VKKRPMRSEGRGSFDEKTSEGLKSRDTVSFINMMQLPNTGKLKTTTYIL